MTGLGLIVMFFGYAIVYWGINAITMNDQGSFMSYLFPWTSFTGLTTTPTGAQRAAQLQPNPSAGKGKGQRPG